MAKLDNYDAYEKLQVQNLQRVLEFLRFAEAKNAGLLTLSSALTIALGNLLLHDKLSGAPKIALWITLSLVMIAGIIALSTFIPRLVLENFLGGKPAGPHPKNLLYFGDIASLSLKDFKEMTEARYGSPSAIRMKPEYLDDLLIQIQVNSQITDRKMRVFRAGATIMTIAGVLAVTTVLGWGIGTVVR